MTLKFNGWPHKTIGHLFYVTSRCVHYYKAISEFKLELQPGNARFWVTIDDFFPSVNLKFDGWHWKTIGHLFYATSSFVYHFIAISQFKPVLQSDNAQFGSKSTIFSPVRPSNLTDDLEKQYGTSYMLLRALCIIPWPWVNSNWSYSLEIPTLGQDLFWPLWPCPSASDLDLLHGHQCCQW